MAALVLPAVLPTVPAANPLDNDAGSGGDAGDSPQEATLIEPGTYDGQLIARIDPADYYAFEAVEGQGILVESWLRPLSLSRPTMVLIDPNGNTTYSYYDGQSLIAPASGTWTVGFFMWWSLDTTSAYSFNLRVVDLPPQDDAGSGLDAGTTNDMAVPLPNGTSTAFMGRFDSEDHFSFHAQEGETIQLTLVPPAGSDFDLALRDDRGDWFAYSGNWDESPEQITRTISRTGTYYAVGLVYYGEGNYTLDLARTTGDGGNESTVQVITPVATGLRGPGALSARGEGVDVLSSAGVWHVAPGYQNLTRTDVYGYQGAARDAAGRLYVGDRGSDRIARLDADGTTPAARGTGPVAFGPDGLLYMYEAGSIVRIDENRNVQRLAHLGWWVHVFDLAFAPDGSLYYSTSYGGTVNRLDLHTGESTVVLELEPYLEGLAFDSQGFGYVANGYRGTVHRFDPSTGNATLFGVGVSGPVHLVFSGSRLYASNLGWGPASEVADGVGYFEVNVTGFHGFQPRFELAPLPDLVITSLEIERAPIRTDFGDVPNVVNERRTVVIEVTNQGEGPAPVGGMVEVFRRCADGAFPGVCRDRHVGSAWLGQSLQPGESVEVRVQWDTTFSLGDQELVATADAYDDVFEDDDRNNHATHRTFVRVGGLGGFL